MQCCLRPQQRLALQHFNGVNASEQTSFSSVVNRTELHPSGQLHCLYGGMAAPGSHDTGIPTYEPDSMWGFGLLSTQEGRRSSRTGRAAWSGKGLWTRPVPLATALPAFLDDLALRDCP